MGKILDNNHAEVAPPLQENEERWYLPLFGVYHPKKPEQISQVISGIFSHYETAKHVLNVSSDSNHLSPEAYEDSQ
jgi:hypothetical protein